MQIAIFDYNEKGQYFIDESNMIWMHGTLLAKRLSFNNPSEAITMHTDEDERQKVEIDGRLVWFVSEPGIWGMILAAKTDEAKTFKRQLKHDILPKLRSQGYYIARRDDETLAAMIVKIKTLQMENDKMVKQLDQIELERIVTPEELEQNFTVFKAFRHVDSRLDGFYSYNFRSTARKVNIVNWFRMFKKIGVEKTIEKYADGFLITFDKNDKTPMSTPIRSYDEFKLFLKAVAYGYYIPGVGGTGEQKELLSKFD